jgi:hypothetical protein
MLDGDDDVERRRLLTQWLLLSSPWPGLARDPFSLPHRRHRAPAEYLARGDEVDPR